MGKKLNKFPFLFKPSETTTSAATSDSPWPWPSCVNNPKTLSFRGNPNICKTMNSPYLHDTNLTCHDHDDHHEQSFSYASEICFDESMVITGLSSDRLFFEPGETSSILEVAKPYDFPYKERATITAMDSTDPFLDFRVSMEEMVEAHGLKDWACLEELLACYLRVNGKSNHGYIVGAFIDLLMNIALASDHSESSAIDEPCSSSSTATEQYSFTSPLSFSFSTCSSGSACLSLLGNEDHEIVVEKM